MPPSPPSDSPAFTLRACVNRRLPPKASCGARGAERLIEMLADEAERHKIALTIERSVCMGFCPHGPNVKVVGGPLYKGVTAEDIPEIIRALTAR